MHGKTRERDDCFEQQVWLLGGAVSAGGKAVHVLGLVGLGEEEGQL